MTDERFDWWGNLRHGGLLLDAARLARVAEPEPPALRDYARDQLRIRLDRFRREPAAHRGDFVAHVLEHVAGFLPTTGTWFRGSDVKPEWARRSLLGSPTRPRHLWVGPLRATLPVFIDDQERLGIGRGQRSISQALHWLRQGPEQLALITNGAQWRLVFAGLDYDAFCEWDVAQWLAAGAVTPELTGFRTLVDPHLWTPAELDAPPPLLAAINDSRQGQSDLSQVLGERVRMAVEALVRGHAPALGALDGVTPAEIYRAGVRAIMRMVVVLFAESREGLLPRDNPVFHAAYSLQGLREQLERTPPHRLARQFAAWPRVLSLFRLIHEGSSHEALPVPTYGGELFAPGGDSDGMARALHAFESACFTHDVMSDADVRDILVLLSRTRVRTRQGRAQVWTTVPVDFVSLQGEYIGILYEGLLDFELRTAPADQPVVFLALGHQPALPLATLEAMTDADIRNLLDKMKKSQGDEEEEGEDEADEEGDAEAGDEPEPEADDAGPDDEADAADVRQTTRARAEAWGRRACLVGGLVSKPRGKLTPERQAALDAALMAQARQVISRVVLPGEWYLVRWGGTRKGSGSFYTPPQLAIPTTHRTLRPLAYDPPATADGSPDLDAPIERWTPKLPEVILALKVCDPACGSGTFPLSALRFLTDALFRSLDHHGRIREHEGRAVLDLILNAGDSRRLAAEALPCRPDDPNFEAMTRAVLRRYVVERCIYGVDLDPLAVELCRLSLWIETLDRRLPFTFLDHKIKVGNALVGAWFDQFLHYPVMAWARDGGDSTHGNGVHFAKDARTRELKAMFQAAKLGLKAFIDGGRLPFAVDLTTVRTGHDDAEAALRTIHELGIERAAERAERYAALRAGPEFRRLKSAFDLWCALWFWPADRLADAPGPEDFAQGAATDAGRALADRIAADRRFFHWELEFPDVFNDASHGFDAILGNPPWDIAKPNSKEFFSAVDPLYRSYGKQEAVGRQRDYFRDSSDTERRWLDYSAGFKAMSNWVKQAGFPFGDAVSEAAGGKPSHDLNLGDAGRNSFDSSQRRHSRWKQKRETSTGYADAEHSFRHQGSADVNLYKLFLEQAHALLADAGRLGFVVPSGLYSDFGTGALRRLFLDHCQWEWLFGFENREGIFDIDSRFKFNPVIVAKGGTTAAIRTAFMRRDLADWERGEQLATGYTREQVVQFSPNSRAILEIQSQRDLEVLTKIYANSVLLGDQSERGWGIKYATEFHMTNDSKLFPPRPKWEEWGYRPDEYSRWIQGPWKPVAELWAELGVKATGERRCAQPPYDTLPIPRADLPPGVILSRTADAWLREEEIPEVTFTDAAGKPLKVKRKTEDGAKEEVEIRGPAVALPLYQGIMIQIATPNRANYLSGANNRATWDRSDTPLVSYLPQFCMAETISNYRAEDFQFAFRAIARSTEERTMIGSVVPTFPAGNSLGLLRTNSRTRLLSFAALVTSYLFDWQLRCRLGAVNLNYAFVAETALPAGFDLPELLALTAAQNAIAAHFAPVWIELRTNYGMRRLRTAFTSHERLRCQCAGNAIVSAMVGIDTRDLAEVIQDCDFPVSMSGLKSFTRQLNQKALWRVDKDKPPEHRHTVLSLVAFHDLQEKVAACGGDVARGIEAFCAQNDGEGWMLPETLRLADYGLGHDDRAQEHQPVRECFGPRFYDWQLAQSAEESWKECHLHARNLLGEAGYQRLQDELAGRAKNEPPARPTEVKKPAGLYD